MHERTVVHHQPKETVSQSPIRAICIGFDFGSTAIKFEIHSNLNSDRQLKPVAHAHRHISYPSTTTNFGASEYRFMAPKQTDSLLLRLKKEHENNLGLTHELIASQSGQSDKPIVMTTLTGFTQSLAVIYEGKTAIIIDEPSLSTKPTAIQKIILEKYLGKKGAENKISTIMKLISLINNPEILTQLFGEPVELSRSEE